MTFVISILTVIGRAAGRLPATALGWASSLLFGRVPSSHQKYVTLLMAGSLLWSLLWVALIAAVFIPGLASFLLDTTPHPGFIGVSLLRLVIVVGLVVTPLAVGLGGYLAPAQEERATGLAAVRQVISGYPIAVLMTAILIFLAAVGLGRKADNIRRGWSATHIPIVIKSGGYERMVTDLQTALASLDLHVSAREAPRALSAPGRLLARLVGNLRALVPDRLVQLVGPGLSIDLYPSDIAISGGARERVRARIAIVSQVPWASAHLTTSAEAQAVEDQLEVVERQVRPRPFGRPAAAVGRTALTAIDQTLLDADLPIDEWDILYRLRLQVERDVLAAARESGSGEEPAAVRSPATRSPRRIQPVR